MLITWIFRPCSSVCLSLCLPMRLCVCVFFYAFICGSVHLLCVSVCLCAHLFVYFSMPLIVEPSILSVSLPACLYCCVSRLLIFSSVYLSAYLSVSSSACLSICVSVWLPVSLYWHWIIFTRVSDWWDDICSSRTVHSSVHSSLRVSNEWVSLCQYPSNRSHIPVISIVCLSFGIGKQYNESLMHVTSLWCTWLW